MIFGSCPYCDHAMDFHVGDKRTPFWGHETCESCGKTFWNEYSRIASRALTEEEFAAEHEVDWDAGTIKKRQPETRIPIDAPFATRMQDDIDALVDKILQGHP